MCVSKENAWNFAYVLPKLSEEEPTQLVVPDALQMGWSESPAFFCAATETARDVADKNFESKKEEPPHELKDIMMDVDWSLLPPLPEISDIEEAQFQKLLEVYIDNFIGLIQCKNEISCKDSPETFWMRSIIPFPLRQSLVAKWDPRFLEPN